MQWTPLEESLWAATARPAPDTPSLAGDIEADIAVVGAGYCGLSSALHLAEAGKSVVVLEAEQPGYGASGRNNGHCVPEWLWQSPDDIVTEYGAATGERMNEFQSAAARLVFSLIREHQIDCEAVQSGMLKVARAGEDADGVRARVAQWARRGKPVQLIETPRLADYVASDAFVAAALFEEGGHVNPLGYCRGLADAALRRGARVHGRSPVSAIERVGSEWHVRAAGGTVTARTVVMATNAFRAGVRSELDRAYTPIRALGVATDPLPPELRQQILPGNHNFQEYRVKRRYGTRFFFFDADGRLVTGGPVGRGVNNTAEDATRVIGARLARTFPQLGEVRFTYRWEGKFDVSPTRTVGVHELAPELYAVIGFSGRGIPTATAMGKDIAAMIVEGRHDAMALPITPLPRNALGPLKELMWHNVLLPVYEWIENR